MGMKLNYGGSRSRSCRVVQDSLSATAMEPESCCWADLPEELLREVLVRVEASERDWPLRKSVVACAGVCRSWRLIMKEVVRLPELSGILTFPISIKQPGPRESLIRCFIKRNRSTHTYDLYLSLTQVRTLRQHPFPVWAPLVAAGFLKNCALFVAALADDGKFLLAAWKCRRATSTDYIISLHTDDISKGSSKYIGKLRSNFLGTKYVIYDTLPPHAGAKMMKSRSTVLVGSKQLSPSVPVGSYPVAHISYELNVLGSRGPRRMNCIMDAIPASAIKPGGVVPLQIEFQRSSIDYPPSFSFFRSKSNRRDKILSGPLDGLRDGQLILKNKSPRWHEQLQCWCLNFHGRVTFASVKNFQLVASAEGGETGPEHEKVILQFGKVGKDVFTMDYCYPISAFQAFAICLSSFDTKIACE